jgi:iron complex outermembrane receptor protein
VEAVVVTARRREENLQTVPATVTAFTPERLKQQNITAVADLTYVAPSLTIASAYTSLNSGFAVRGLSTGVTTYFSDAPCCASSANMPFMDIGSVQVLNGPQGTLFGRSSAAGAVIIDPEHPKLDRYEGFVDVIVGNYDRAQFTGVVNIPLITDHLAIRLAANSNNVQGYTRVIGTGQHLDGVNNQQYRIGIEFKAGGFDNYLVGQHFNVDESATSEILAGADLHHSLYNTPASAGQATFGSVCAQAVTFGFSPDVASCVTQRVGILNRIQSTLESETARLAGGGSAVRQSLPSYDGQQQFNQEKRDTLIDIAQYDFGDLGFAKVSIKNIASFDSVTSMVAGLTDGIGGIAEESSFAETNSDGGSNQIGNRMTTELPPRQKTYNDEFQIRGDTADGLLIWTLGNFYSKTKIPQNLQGTGVVYKIFGGALLPNLGYSSADGFSGGGYAKEEAIYGQGTLNLSRLGIHGLSLTAGYRKSWDSSENNDYLEVFNYPSGVITPAANVTTARTKNSGYNYTFSAQEQVNHDLMVYGTISRAYVPGGINPLNSGTASLPNFTQTYTPETVINKELGVKYDFHIGGMAGRFDAAVYQDNFTNIIESFTGVVGASSVVYQENVAAAKLKGAEFEVVLLPTDAWEITAGYSYNDAHYTHWIGQDPFNVAQPGSAACLSSSPAGFCFMDLSDNPFARMPKQQGHVTVRYRLPVDDALGRIILSATGYAQSRVYYEATAARDLQILPGDLEAISQKPYAMLNLRADWRNVKGSGWDAAVFANNVTNQVYAAGKIAQTITLGFSIANYAPPRMFGIEVSRKFGD